MKTRFALTQKGKIVNDHWGKPIFFDNEEQIRGYIDSPPAMVGILPAGVSYRETTCTRESGNHLGPAFAWD